MNLKQMRENAGTLPRGTCPVCHRDVALRRKGELREHNDELGELCKASGHNVEDAQAMFVVAKPNGAAHPGAPAAERVEVPGSLADRARRAMTDRAEEVAKPASTDPAPKPEKMATPPPPAPPEGTPDMALGQTYALLRTDQLLPDPKNRDVGDVSELAQSIHERGILQPLLVEPDFDASVPSDEDGAGMRYRIVMGHRRKAAAELAGMLMVPCIIRPSSVMESATEGERARAIDAAIENIQRKDLTPLEEGQVYQRLLDLGLDQKATAAQVGKSQSHVSKRLTLLKLPEPIQETVARGHLTLESAQMVGKLRNTKAMAALWEQVGGQFDVDGRLGETTDLTEAQRAEETAELLEMAERNLRWRVEQVLREAELEAKARIAVREAKAKKLTLIEDPQDYFVRYPLQWAKGPRRVGRSHGDLKANPTEHAGEPCHVVYVDPGSGELRPGCSEPARHKRGGPSKLKTSIVGLEGRSAGKPAKTPKETPEQKEARKAQEAAVARMEEIETTRRSWVAIQAGGIKQDVLSELYAHAFASFDDYVEPGLIATLMGLEAGSAWGAANKAIQKAVIGAGGKVEPKMARKLLAAQVLALYEEELEPFHVAYGVGAEPEIVGWEKAQPYFDWLESTGYEIQPEERQRLGGVKKPRRTRASARRSTGRRR